MGWMANYGGARYSKQEEWHDVERKVMLKEVGVWSPRTTSKHKSENQHTPEWGRLYIHSQLTSSPCILWYLIAREKQVQVAPQSCVDLIIF